MTVNINASTNSKRIPIGRCEDNEATRVVFDCSGFSSAYGSGQATLLHRRSKEKISYIVQNVTQEDDTVTWTVSSDDTAFSGEGTLQLMWTVNDVVAHSVFYTTITDPSLTDSSTEPTEVKSALQLLIDSCYTKEETDDLIAHMRAGSDWDANEGEDGYIENRPFYTETVEGEEVVHQLDPKYISGKFITSGTGENSEVYNDISNNVASGNYSHAEGYYTTASGFGSHSEGSGSKYATKYTGTNESKLPGAVGNNSHVECDNGRAEGVGSHVEGNTCFTGNYYGHAEGEWTSSIGRSSHSEGFQTVANGDYSHSEGQNCVTSSGASCSHAEGQGSEARGQYSHSEGCYTVATSDASHVGGKYNIVDSDRIYAEIIGNGTSNAYRSNARTLDWSGNESLAGSLTLGMGTADETTITPTQLAKLLSAISKISTDDISRVIINRTINKIENREVDSIRSGAFRNCTGLTTVNFPMATSIGSYAFYGCTGLTTVNFPMATSIGNGAFSSCTGLTAIDFPLVESIDSTAFMTCSELTLLDFSPLSSIGARAFKNCSKLTTLIIRKSDSVCNLINKDAFQGTPVYNGLGYIYVPSALVDAYKADSYWKSYSAQFRALEDYTLSGTINGALDPSKI